MSSKILIVDDEKDICFLISEILIDEKFVTETALNSTEAINKYKFFQPDLVILDVWLGNSELDGMELLLELKRLDPVLPIIIISGHGTVNMAVNAIKNGAYDFLEKPFNSEKILILAKRAIESSKLISENELLKKIADPEVPMIGNSSFTNDLRINLNKISTSKSRILISGPQGSGKKLIAQSIHKSSLKSKNIANIIDFKKINEVELIEMFQEDKNMLNKNLLISSNNNTLILYNIDNLPINFQKKLLMYLENDKLYKNYDIDLNIKIISITSKILEDEVIKGNFVQNLYDRISLINVKVPPICERREDIIPICKYYLDYFNLNKKYKFLLSKNSSNKLEAYDWPGNVRQIINYIEKTIILNQDLNIQSDYELGNLPIDMGDYDENNNISNNFSLSLKDARKNFEKEYLLSQIKRFNGNIAKISEFTGMERTALYRKFKSLNISLEKNN